MQIHTLKTTEDIVAEEGGALFFRIVALRNVVEQQKQEIATLKMEIAKLTPTEPPA